MTGFFYSKAFGVCSPQSNSHPIMRLGGHRCSLREDTTHSFAHSSTYKRSRDSYLGDLWKMCLWITTRMFFWTYVLAATFRCIYVHLQVCVQIKGSFWVRWQQLLPCRELTNCFLSSCYIFLSPPLGYEAPRVPHPPWPTVAIPHCHPGGYQIIPYYDLTCLSLLTNHVQQRMCMWHVHISSKRNLLPTLQCCLLIIEL